MASSKTDILNTAATYISEGRVIDYETDTGETARTLNFMYDQARRKTLRSAKWGPARTYVTISADSTAPAFKWSYAYTLPVDYLRLVAIQETDVDSIKCPRFEKVGRKLYTNEAAPLKVIYIKDLEEVGDMDDLLIDAIALRVAADTAYSRTDSMPLAEMLDQKWRAVISQAKTTDTQEQRRALVDPYYHSQWDSAHFGGSGAT